MSLSSSQPCFIVIYLSRLLEVGFFFKGHLDEYFKQKVFMAGASKEEGEARAVQPSREEGELVFISSLLHPCLVPFLLG